MEHAPDNVLAHKMTYMERNYRHNIVIIKIKWHDSMHATYELLAR